MPDVLFCNVHAVINYTVTGSKQVPNTLAERRVRRPKRTARAISAFDRINTGFKSRESGNLPNGEAKR
jgi:hypothetical protein